MSCLPCVEVEPTHTADCTVIWLHGLGANGHDFEPLVPQLALPPKREVRFVFPHAPVIPVTVNGGYPMPAWYDILEMSLDRQIDSKQLCQSAEAVQNLVEREVERGIDSRRIILAGFSQGGAVAYQAALTCPRPLAGLLVLSSYFATADTLVPATANRDLPILIQHGTLDPVVPESLGSRAARQLGALGYPVEYQTYTLEHGVGPQQLPALNQWLEYCLS